MREKKLKPEDDKEEEIFDDSFMPIAVSRRKGRVVVMDISMKREDEVFIFTVGTDEYLTDVEKYNKTQPEELQLPYETVYRIPGVAEIDLENVTVRGALERFKKAPLDELAPYLVKQDLSDLE
ncbi:hypothetical protein HYT33_04500 [Candidatus Roizmanbacteria bacterium]|nr:hypothetical protein [Candidatus Roizmanbacteria bacterium]